MTTSKTVKIVLDDDFREEGKSRSITFDNRAEFRMGSLDRPFTLADLRSQKRSWAALVAWVWSCLDVRDALDFPSPEDLAPHIQTKDTIASVFEAFLDSYNAATDEPSKNASG